MPDKKISDEIAALTEAVRELREDEVTVEVRSLRVEVEKLRAGQGTHHCHGCHCMHIQWYPTTWTTGAGSYPNYVVTTAGSSAAITYTSSGN